jgi:D-alanyl-D-alanine carboxypeptidase (penicillin-binding protein 5/6)
VEVLSVAPPAVVKKTLTVEKLSSSGIMLIDATSSQEIYSVNPDVHRPIASLTKMMTALLIIENHSLSEVVTVPAIAEQIRGSTIGISPGQHLTVGSLLKALLIPSANDAAYTLAAFHSRSIPTFVQQMNKRAAALGMKNTHFTNPAGFDGDEQYSTPRDVAWLTMAALRHPEFRSIVATRSAAIVSDDGKEYHLRNTNELLHENQDVFGVKTGTTDDARECLVVLFRSAGKPYVLVLLGSHDRYTDSLYVLQALGAAVQ